MSKEANGSRSLLEQPSYLTKKVSGDLRSLGIAANCSGSGVSGRSQGVHWEVSRVVPALEKPTEPPRGNFTLEVLSEPEVPMPVRFLDGLENVVPPIKSGRQISFVRYADDFIVTARLRSDLENTIEPAIINWLRARGLPLSEEKIRIRHIRECFSTYLAKKPQEWSRARTQYTCRS